MANISFRMDLKVESDPETGGWVMTGGQKFKTTEALVDMFGDLVPLGARIERLEFRVPRTLARNPLFWDSQAKPWAKYNSSLVLAAKEMCPRSEVQVDFHTDLEEGNSWRAHLDSGVIVVAGDPCLEIGVTTNSPYQVVGTRPVRQWNEFKQLWESRMEPLPIEFLRRLASFVSNIRDRGRDIAVEACK